MSKRKLLLADDSITIQKVVNLTFADEGIEVTTVGDGDSAMEKLREMSPDLVMADVNMPGLSGYQICESIKQDNALRHTPVILLVGSFEPFDEEEAKRVGADGFLTKPFQSIRQLVTKVTDLLNADKSKVEEIAPEPVYDSFSETLKMPNPPYSEPQRFSDDEFDDETIQTSQVGGFLLDEAQKFETKPVIQYDAEEDYGKTQPLTTEEVKDFAFSDVAVSTETQTVGNDHLESNEPSEYSDNLEDTIADAETVSNELEESQPEESTSEIEETGEIEESNDYSTEPTTELTETEDNLEESESVETEGNLEISESDETESHLDETDSHLEELETEPEETPKYLHEAKTEELPYPVSASILDFDDDILELPPVEGEEFNEVEEPTAEKQEETASHSFVSGTSSETVAEESSTTAISTDSPQISDELIDLIVQKVIEKLSDKAVKDVAWEVVPQMSELIIRQIAEEKLKD